MSENIKHIIKDSNPCISDTEMRHYNAGQLSPADMHRVEKHLLDCELCSDAQEGLQMLKDNHGIKKLEREIEKTILGKERKGPIVIWLRQNVRYVAAAAVVVMVAGAFLMQNALKKETVRPLSETLQEAPASGEEITGNKTVSVADSVITPPATVSTNGFSNQTLHADEKPPALAESSTENADLISMPSEPSLASKEENKPVTIVMKDESDAAAAERKAEPQSQQKADDISPAAGAAPAPAENTRSMESERGRKSVAKPQAAPAKPTAGVEEDKRTEGYNVKEKALLKEVATEQEEISQDTTSLKARKKNAKGEYIYDIAEEMPAYPGGDTAMRNFFKKNIQYPPSVSNLFFSGTVYVRFLVESDGAISNIVLLRGLNNCKECDEEALRVVKIMPRWQPGRQSGKNVPVYYNMPVKFDLK